MLHILEIVIDIKLFNELLRRIGFKFVHYICISKVNSLLTNKQNNNTRYKVYRGIVII